MAQSSVAPRPAPAAPPAAPAPPAAGRSTDGTEGFHDARPVASRAAGLCLHGSARLAADCSQQRGVGVGVGVGRGPQSRDQLDNVYDQARMLIERNQYDRAIDVLDRVISGNGSQAPGAMYWKAYSLARIDRRPGRADDTRRAAQAVSEERLDQGCAGARGRGQAGVGTVGERRSAERRRAEAAGAARAAAERPGSGAAGDREDAERVEQRPRQGPGAVPRQPEPVDAGTRADPGRRQGQRQPGSAAAGDPLHRPDGRARGVAGAGRGLSCHQRGARQARDHPCAGQRQRPRASAGAGQGRDVGGTAR